MTLWPIARRGFAAPPTPADATRDLSPMIRSAAGGDEQAFAELYDATATDAFAVAYARTRCPQAASEVVQSSFQAVWRDAPRFEASWISGRAWVLAIVHENARLVAEREAG